MAVNTIHAWISKQHIRVPAEWVEECVNFLKSEGITAERLQDSVYEQWMVGDLAMLQEPVLKAAIQNGSQFVGSHALQVNYMLDISKPKFHQVRNLLGRNVGNLDVQELEDPQTKWEPKASRCLLLEITDGVTKVKAIELEPLAELNSALDCGAKVILRGPIRCINNCLLLKRGSIRVLGGHVDELMEKYQPLQILQQLLRQTEDFCPEICSKKFPNPGKISGGKVKVKPQTKYPVSRMQKVETKPNFPAKVEPAADWDEQWSDNELLLPETKEQAAMNCSFNSDWSGDGLPTFQKEKGLPSHNSTAQPTHSADDLNWSEEELADSFPSKPAQAAPDQSAMLWSDEDDELVETVVSADGHSNSLSHFPTRDKPANRQTSTGSTRSSAKPLQSTVPKPLQSNVPKPLQSNVPKPLQSNVPKPLQSNVPKPLQSNVPKSLQSNVPKPLQSNVPKPLPSNALMREDISHKSIETRDPRESIIDLLSSSDEEWGEKSVDASSKGMKRPSSPDEVKSARQKGAGDSLCSPSLTAGSPQQGENSINKTPQKNSCSSFHQPHFHYLSQLSAGSTMKSGSIIVKAHISTVLDKIGRSADKTRWTLNVRINDGTAYLDCLVSHQIIEHHIGPVKAALRKSKSDITEKRIIIQLMKNFASWLAAVNGIMEVDISNPAQPVILDIRPPNSKDIQLFKKCLSEK